MGDLLAEAAFQSALVASAVVAAVVWATRHVAHPFGWASAALVGAVVGLAIGSIAPAVVWAVVLLAAAGALVNGRTAWLAVPLGVGAAIALAQAVPSSGTTWMRVVAVVATLVLVPLTSLAGRTRPRALPVLLLATAVGVYVCVPETDQVVALLGALVPAAVLGVLLVRIPERAALWPLVGLLVWVTVGGGVLRPGSVVGGVACFGVLFAAPLLRFVPEWLLVVVQVPLVVYLGRVAGFEQDALDALVLALAALAVATAVLAAGAGVTRHRMGATSR